MCVEGGCFPSLSPMEVFMVYVVGQDHAKPATMFLPFCTLFLFYKLGAIHKFLFPNNKSNFSLALKTELILAG